MIGAGNDFLVDDDALLGLELLDQGRDVLGRHHRILVAMYDQSGRRTGCEEREVIQIGGGGHREEGPAFPAGHPKMHSEPGTAPATPQPAAAALRRGRLWPGGG